MIEWNNYLLWYTFSKQTMNECNMLATYNKEGNQESYQDYIDRFTENKLIHFFVIFYGKVHV